MLVVAVSGTGHSTVLRVGGKELSLMTHREQGFRSGPKVMSKLHLHFELFICNYYYLFIT